MNKKIFGFFISAVLLAALVLAASFSVSPSSVTFSQSSLSSAFTINPSSSVNVSFTSPQILDESGAQIPITLIPNTFTNINTSQSFNVTIAPDFSKLLLGKTYSGALRVNNANNASSDNQQITLNIIKSFCDFGEKGTNLTIDRLDINNLDGDDTEWMPLDDIEVKVRVVNNNADDSDRIDTDVELGLYDSKGKEKLDLDKIDLGRIKGDGEYLETTFKFQVPSDLGVDSSSYSLFVKAYQSGKKDAVCTSTFDSDFFQDITITREDDEERFVIPYETSAEPSPAQCGEQVVLKAKMANIGDEDQEKIKVKIFNKELGINDYKVIDGLNQDDSSEDIEFTFTIPSNATEKSYSVELESLYSFNDDHPSDDDDAYDDSSESFFIPVRVSGNCIKPIVNNVQVAASVESAPKAGEEMIVRANVKNLGDSTTLFMIVPAGIDSFATLEKVEPQTVTLEAGKSQDVLIYLNVNKDASGEQSFNINAVYSGNTKTFKVTPFTIEAKSSIFNLSFLQNAKDNWFIWVIVLVNVVLIVLIVVVAVRIARK